MTFLWPQALWLLGAVPLLIAGYLWVLRRSRGLMQRYAHLALLREAGGSVGGIRRHLPPALFLLAVVAMIVAMARPSAVVTLPARQQTVVLAIDVSGSMRAADIEPNRLGAAKAAARQFVEEQPATTRVGIVAFAATALVVQHPTRNREDLLAAMERLQLQRGTAIGSGLVVALSTIFPKAGISLESVSGKKPAVRAQAIDEKDGKDGKDKDASEPVPPGSFDSAAIILLTDGQSTTGPEPMLAAKLAADRGVRVFTVGVGTADGEVMGFEGWKMRVRLDEATLKGVSNATRGLYYYAGDSAELSKVYRALNSRFGFERRETEITAMFAAIAAALATLSALLSLLWFNRIL